MLQIFLIVKQFSRKKKPWTFFRIVFEFVRKKNRAFFTFVGFQNRGRKVETCFSEIVFWFFGIFPFRIILKNVYECCSVLFFFDFFDFCYFEKMLLWFFINFEKPGKIRWIFPGNLCLKKNLLKPISLKQFPEQKSAEIKFFRVASVKKKSKTNQSGIPFFNCFRFFS